MRAKKFVSFLKKNLADFSLCLALVLLPTQKTRACIFIVVRFLPLVIDHNPGYKSYPGL